MRLRNRGNEPPNPAPGEPVAGPPAAKPVQPVQPVTYTPPGGTVDVPQQPDAAQAPVAATDPGLAPGAGAPPEPAATAAPQQPAPVPAPQQHVIHRTRIGGIWVGIALAAVVLLLLLVFILENEQSANIGYFGAHGRLPLGVALLLAALAGVLLVLIPGSARIMQLRKTARRHRQMDATARQQAAPPAGSGPGTA
jgi:lipopolysaccharide assembly protein A